MSLDKISSIEELKQFFNNGRNLGFDAEFSPQTQKIVEVLGAKGAHLNKWWVRTPVDWVCPSCKRKKAQIAKLDSRDYASCQLHEHHDHMRDIVRRMFEQMSSSKETVVATELAERFAIRTSFAISAYDNTVICADCNKADGLAKIKINAHKDFSFSPDEIGMFVKPQDHKEHEIDTDIALKIWQESIPTFNKRMKLAQYIASLAAGDAHWYQPSVSTAKQLEKKANYLFDLRGLSELHYDPEKLLYNSMPFKGNYSSWRLNPKPQTKGKPTEGQIAHLSKTRGRYWVKYDDNWCCPCCKRSKYDCLKPSKKNPWVFEVKSILAHNSEHDTGADIINVCNECFNASNHLGREAIEEVKDEDLSVDVPFPHSLITFDELKSVVSARPHSTHAINNVVADEIIKNAIIRIFEENYYQSSLRRAMFPIY